MHTHVYFLIGYSTKQNLIGDCVQNSELAFSSETKYKCRCTAEYIRRFNKSL